MEKTGDQIQASQTVPGHRYQTAKGVVVEMAVSVLGSKGISSPFLHRLDNSKNFVTHPVNPDGTTDYTRFNTGIPGNYFFGVGVPGWGFQPPPKAVKPKPVDHVRAKPGRKPLPPCEWRGLARQSGIPHSLLTMAKSEGCYAHSVTHYLLVGYEGRSLFALFRNGNVGFHNRVDTPDFELLSVKPLVTRFMPYRLQLSDVIKNKKSESLLRVAQFIVAQAKNGKSS